MLGVRGVPVLVIPCRAKAQYCIEDYPCIVDNGWCQSGQPSVQELKENIMRYRPQFAIALDFDLKTSLRLKERYPWIKWVYPAHKREELKVWRYGFLVGFCTRRRMPNQGREYTLREYLSEVPRGYRFLLGLSWEDLFELPLDEFDYADVAFVFSNARFGKDLRGRRTSRVDPRQMLIELEQLIRSIRRITDYL